MPDLARTEEWARGRFRPGILLEERRAGTGPVWGITRGERNKIRPSCQRRLASSGLVGGVGDSLISRQN